MPHRKGIRGRISDIRSGGIFLLYQKSQIVIVIHGIIMLYLLRIIDKEEVFDRVCLYFFTGLSVREKDAAG